MATIFENVLSRAQKPFVNEPITDFSKPDLRQAQADALEQVKSQLGRTYPPIIGGKRIQNGQIFASVNPANPEQVVGYFASATPEQVNEAVQAATATFEHWRRVPA